MARDTKISVCMIIKNAEHLIHDALESVKGWADEIVIVDSGSTDGTCALAKKYTDKIFHREWDIEGAQRNYAAGCATHDWVMWLDADERMTPELKAEIDTVFSGKRDKAIAVYRPKRKNYIGTYWLRHGGWYPAPHVKLYNKTHVRWKEDFYDIVHPGIDRADGFRGALLESDLIHLNFRNIEDYIMKVNKLSTLEAQKWHLMGRKYSALRGFWKGVERFWQRYIARGGYKDGFYGFVAAFLSCFYQWASYMKYREYRITNTIPKGPSEDV